MTNEVIREGDSLEYQYILSTVVLRVVYNLCCCILKYNHHMVKSQLIAI
jgi:hypothetical protein